jgi:hypothetical protein
MKSLAATVPSMLMSNLGLRRQRKRMTKLTQMLPRGRCWRRN